MDPTGLSVDSPAANSPAFFDVKALSLRLTCSPRHCRRLADCGRMPQPLKLGALLRWNRAEIEEWIAGGCKPVRHTSVKGRRQG